MALNRTRLGPRWVLRHPQSQPPARAVSSRRIQVKDAQLLQVSLEVNAASREAYLRIPLLFGVVIQ